MRDDYYRILDVEPTASAEAVKQAYHAQAKKYHPDHNAGDAAAAERFKLVAEAWRVLGNAERRELYDAALHNGNRLDVAPELAAMPHHARVSRAGRERRRKERRAGERRDDALPRKPRFFLVSRNKPMRLWVMVGLYVFCMAMVLPPIISVMNPVTLPPIAPTARMKAEAADKHLPADVMRERLQQRAEECRLAAEEGDAAAQMRYGLMLYNGIGIAMDRPAAKLWWERAAEQGNTAAASYLQHWTETPPAAEEDKEAKAESVAPEAAVSAAVPEPQPAPEQGEGVSSSS